MSQTVTFRPVEANLTHDTDWLGKMDPYCQFSSGTNRAKSSVCRHGGTRPHWGDSVQLQTNGNSGVVHLEVFDKDKFRPDDHIAYTDIDLNEIQQRGSLSRWYPLYHHKKPAGEILIEAAVQQQLQSYAQQVPVTYQQTIPTTYVQETLINSAPISTVVGESYVVSNPAYTQTSYTQNVSSYTQGVPLQTGLQQGTNTTYYTSVDPNAGLIGNNAGLIGNNTGFTDNNAGYTSGLPSKVSGLGPSGGLPHGHHSLKGQTNAGYSERPGYTLGDTEANTTLQSNLDSNGGGLFNKPGRERRTEPYSLSNPGTYGIPHGQTIDTAGHLQPGANLDRQAPIGTLNHPGYTGYPDGFNVPPGVNLKQQAGFNSGLNQQGQQGFGQQGLGQQGLGQQGLGQQGLGQQVLGQQVLGQQGLSQGSYGTGLQSNLGQGSYNAGVNQNLGQGGQF